MNVKLVLQHFLRTIPVWIFATSSGGTLGNFGRKIAVSKLKDLIVLLNHIEQGVTDIKASLWELGMACRIKAITSSLFFKNTHLLGKKGLS